MKERKLRAPRNEAERRAHACAVATHALATCVNHPPNIRPAWDHAVALLQEEASVRLCETLTPMPADWVRYAGVETRRLSRASVAWLFRVAQSTYRDFECILKAWPGMRARYVVHPAFDPELLKRVDVWAEATLGVANDIQRKIVQLQEVLECPPDVSWVWVVARHRPAPPH